MNTYAEIWALFYAALMCKPTALPTEPAARLADEMLKEFKKRENYFEDLKEENDWWGDWWWEE